MGEPPAVRVEIDTTQLRQPAPPERDPALQPRDVLDQHALIAEHDLVPGGGRHARHRLSGAGQGPLAEGQQLGVDGDPVAHVFDVLGVPPLAVEQVGVVAPFHRPRCHRRPAHLGH